MTLDGYVVDVAAHPVAYGWSFGDGTTARGDRPGSADAPLRATYRRRGDYAVVALRHVGGPRATSPHPRSASTSVLQYLGTVTLPEPVTYHVAEIRALLRSRAARG